VKQSKPKKSKVVILHVPPEKLATLKENPKKRKAEGLLMDQQRPAKRLSAEPLASSKNVRFEKSKGRLIAKMKVGTERLRSLGAR
jgi:hypothetical protein